MLLFWLLGLTGIGGAHMGPVGALRGEVSLCGCLSYVPVASVKYSR